MNVKIDRESGDTTIVLDSRELQTIMYRIEDTNDTKDPDNAFYHLYREICNEAYKP